MADFHSKHGIVSRPNSELYMYFVDMRNFAEMIPEDKRSGVRADFDTISAVVQGFNIGVRVVTRSPYFLIELQDDGCPFHFTLSLHFDSLDQMKTDFYVDLKADLNMMMKMMLGGKIREALDKVVDGLVAVSEGRMPEGFDPSAFRDGKMPF